MKVLFVTPSFYPATFYGGPTFVNRAFCDALAKDEAVELRVLTTDANGPNRIDLTSVEAAAVYEVNYCRRRLPPDIAPGLLRRLPKMIRWADVVHLNGVYSFTTIPTLALCRLMRRPVVWSPHGALQTGRQGSHPRRKKLFEKICDALCANDLVMIHSMSLEEQQESLPQIRNARYAVVRYGTELPEPKRPRSRAPGDLRMLFVGRLHPIKGLENLFAALTLTKQQATLAVCGEGSSAYKAQLRARVRELGLDERVHFHGSVSGESKEQQFRAADICVVPSFRESFGLVVAEALARGVPVIAAQETPWQGLVQERCGLWVSNEPAELARAIDRAATMPLAEMGSRGRAWMEREFSWELVTGKMLHQYDALMEAGSKFDGQALPQLTSRES